MTHNALAAPFVRNAMAAAGASLPQDLFPKMDANVFHEAARRTTGLGKSTRSGSSHFLAGAQPFGDLFLIQRAEFLGSCLRSVRSSVRWRGLEELGLLYEIGDLEPEACGMEVPGGIQRRPGISCAKEDPCGNTAWRCVLYVLEPDIGGCFVPPGTYSRSAVRKGEFCKYLHAYSRNVRGVMYPM